ncbi:MAG: tetratricopeptide repeat protein [Candidatus Hydrogenedentota bacterium]
MHKREAAQKFQQSKTLFAQKRYPEALILLDELNAAFPNEKHIMYARAMCLAEMQRPLDAMQVCEQAVDMHNDEKSQELLNQLRREHGHLEEGPTDLASLMGGGPAAPDIGNQPGLPDIPSVPDVPDFPAMQPQSSNKRFYIILGSVAGLAFVLLIGFPLIASLTKDSATPETEETVVSEESGIEEDAQPSPPTEVEAPAGTETQATPTVSEAESVQWYYAYEEGKDIAQEYERPLCIFFHDGGKKGQVGVDQFQGHGPPLGFRVGFEEVRFGEKQQAAAAGAQRGLGQQPDLLIRQRGGRPALRLQRGKLLIQGRRRLCLDRGPQRCVGPG